jgi:uncharacterized membrane protein
MTGMQETAAPRRMRWLKIALVVSLALNLAVAGLVAGAALKGRPDAGGRDGLWPYSRALPEPYRGDLMRALRDSRRDWIADREALGSTRAELAAALVAEPFDAAAVTALLARQRDRFTALADRGAALLVEQIARMSPEERRAYAEALERGPRGRERTGRPQD